MKKIIALLALILTSTINNCQTYKPYVLGATSTKSFVELKNDFQLSLNLVNGKSKPLSFGSYKLAYMESAKVLSQDSFILVKVPSLYDSISKIAVGSTMNQHKAAPVLESLIDVCHVDLVLYNGNNVDVDSYEKTDIRKAYNELKEQRPEFQKQEPKFQL